MREDQYYGFVTARLDHFFEGGLTYCNTFCLDHQYEPYAVYKVAAPNLEKGHKDYLLLKVVEGKTWVNGKNIEDMEKWRYQNGLHCQICDEVIFSCYRHDFKHCKCEGCNVDGGKDYFKYGGTNFKVVNIDLLEDRICPWPEEPSLSK
jgi:hypothetical protein